MVWWSCILDNVEVELTSAEPERAIAAFAGENLTMYSIHKTGVLNRCFWVPRKEYARLKRICGKRGDSVQIIRRGVLYWIGGQLRSRPLLLAGAAVFFLLILLLPSRILFVRVEGNSQIPTRRILEAAENCGICFGASRRQVRSERAKNAILEELSQLQWIGVNTAGCVATVSVREKVVPASGEYSDSISGILAVRDGYILSATATSGTLLVQPGESVTADQILISPYTDCGLCIRAEGAAGEVYAQTSRDVDMIMPANRLWKGSTETTKRKYSLLLRKKRINLWKDSGIWEGSCGRMYEEYYITLPGGFRLPVALCVETYQFCKTKDTALSREKTESALKLYAEDYLLAQTVAGNILSGKYVFWEENGVFRLQGNYACVEMIGTVRQEQIGDTNGENS